TLHYGYDGNGRLTGQERSQQGEPQAQQASHGWRFDPAGNRLPEPPSAQALAEQPDWPTRVRQNLHSTTFDFLTPDLREESQTAKSIGAWADNRIGHNAGVHYRHDAWGNRREALHLNGTRQQLHYDALDRLTEIITHSPQPERPDRMSRTTYRYDPLERRLAKTTDSEDESYTRYYGWDGDRLVREEDEEQLLNTVYEPGSFIPLLRFRRSKAGRRTIAGTYAEVVSGDDPGLQAQIEAELHQLPEATCNEFMLTLIKALREMPNPQRSVYLHSGEGEIDINTFTEIKQRLQASDDARIIKLEYYHCDHLGTPIALSDLEGKVIWRAEYDPWGNILEEYNPDNIEQSIRFQGQQYDEESGLHYNRHRYYDPNIGTYITQDPIGLQGGVNLYAYAASNPLIYTDPNGLDCVYSISAGTMKCTNSQGQTTHNSSNWVSGLGGKCQNNPSLACISQSGVGSIPPGDYTSTGIPAHRQGTNTTRRSLTPDPNNKMYNRSTFQTHYCPNTKTCSNGCPSQPDWKTIQDWNKYLDNNPNESIKVAK
ncbi:MAG: RHS domain-containing protein, partial [Chromatiales bacterium]|nr:RHS domain-containing protein [Chromatiales bacterium]